MTAVEEKYQFTTAEESVTGKDWAAGSAKQIETKEFVIKAAKLGAKYVYTGSYVTLKYSPAWWKIIDEPLVNALDHLIRQLGTSEPVTCIKVGFDKNGRVRIYNDGPGIEVEVHKVASEKMGKTMYVPTFIFGILFQGSNRTRSDDCIIGGTNGLGAKLSNCFSIEFTAETVRKGWYFIQRWRNHKEIAEDPIIRDVATVPADRRHDHTTLSFLPDYTGLFGYEKFGDDDYAVLSDIVRTRVFFACAYAQYSVGSSQKFEMWFNDEKIEVKSITDIAAIMFPGMPTVSMKIAPTIDPKAKSRIAFRYPWEICAVLTATNPFNNPQLSNVNGVMVRDGKHTKHVMNLIVDGVKEKMTKIFQDKNMKFSPTYVTNNTFLFMNTKIPNPNWTGQRKDVLDMDIRKFSGYSLDTKFINLITDKVRDQIVEAVFNDIPAASGKKKTKQSQYEKYVPAKHAGGKKSADCVLIPVEGDSAMTQVCTGIAHNLGFDKHGVISLGGVIMNARKECTVVETATTKYVKKSTKLINNIFMNVLMDVTGLNPAYKYDPLSVTYKKEIAELSYGGGIAACVDQDLDGKGNILGLLLSTFELFWPNLLRAGYVKWFCTPIIRAYPKAGGNVLSFYTTANYDTWGQTVDLSKWLIRYYKGIGTHSRDETIHMFKSFRDNLYTYYMDERSHELFEVYFGDEPDLRKRELSKPTKIPDIAKIAIQERTKMISCSDHLENETNLYQKDNLERKLDHVIDGQNQAGRKILDGLIKALPGNKEMKVAQIAGFVSEYENYHHGETGLGDSITGRGLVTTGGKQLPLIIPLSNFGSRKAGGNDAASARYIWTKLNKNIVNLIFPECDYWLLPFNFDDGKRSEPKYFMPIIPMAILESAELPAHGWKLKTWARDVFKCLENVRRLIRLGDDIPLLKMPPTTYKGAPYEWKGEFKTIRGDIYSFGKYTLDDVKGVIRIIELPLRVWTTTFVNNIKKKMNSDDDKIIAAINDESDDISVNIEVKLKPGALALLNIYGDSIFTDGIEEYFQLRDRMDSHINLMGKDGEVIMFENYESVMHKWFPVRKEYYGKRIARSRAVLILKVRLVENIIRYVELCNEMNMSRKKSIEQNRILEEKKFDKIHSGKLNSPKFTPTEELENVILRGPKSNFDYLLNLTDKRKSEEALEDYNNDLRKLHDDIISLDDVASKGRFSGAVIWEAELDALEASIREGQKTFWKYGDENKFVLK